jgi:thiol-disulfide isomerase/thioredoxin
MKTVFNVLKGLTFLLLTGHLTAYPGNATASELRLDAAVQNDFARYLDAPLDRAFAIAPGGAWGWSSGSLVPEVAEQEALQRCRQHTEQPCHIYAVNDRIVLDPVAWASSWKLERPVDGIPLQVGIQRGKVFPDLAFSAPDGRPLQLSEFRGKTVFLHFWGSWCPPCKAELPEIAELHDALSEEEEIVFVLLQVREPLHRSERWMGRQRISLPLHDSGHSGRKDDSFDLANGGKVDDRALAPVYPTTYVLDSLGRVVFSSRGPVENWIEFAPLIRQTH